MGAVIEDWQATALRRRWYCRAILNDSHPQSRRPPDPPQLELELRGSDGGRLWASVSGEIDFASAPSMQTRIAAACVEYEARALILDLAGVEFMDSSGLRAILHLQRELGSGRSGVVLLGPTEQVRGILTLTGLDQHLPVADTLEQAETLLAREGCDNSDVTEEA